MKTSTKVFALSIIALACGQALAMQKNVPQNEVTVSFSNQSNQEFLVFKEESEMHIKRLSPDGIIHHERDIAYIKRTIAPEWDLDRILLLRYKQWMYLFSPSSHATVLWDHDGVHLSVYSGNEAKRVKKQLLPYTANLLVVISPNGEIQLTDKTNQ